MKKMALNPLLHFLLLGAFLFLLFRAVNPASLKNEVIVIDDETLLRTIDLFKREWNRPPTENELKALIEGQLQREVYYRQALKMKLDRNDEIIKRRMEQKLLFITNDLTNLIDPPEDSLRDYFKKHRNKYAIPAQISYSQIFFNPGERKNARGDALTVLHRLPESDANFSELAKKGDAFDYLQQVLQKSIAEVAGKMGNSFADTLFNVKTGVWSGPIGSPYGFHLVFVREHSPTQSPDWAKIREEVLRDYKYDQSQKLNETIYLGFRRQYKIQIQLNDSNLKKLPLWKKMGFDEN